MDNPTNRASEDPIDLAAQRLLQERGSECTQQGADTAARRREIVTGCDAFGIDPLDSKQLAAFRCEAATQFESGWTILVTAGGLKLRYRDGMRRGLASCDGDTVDRLKMMFGCYYRNSNGDTKERPLPDDLTLSREAIKGFTTKSEHPYRGTFDRREDEAEVRRRDRLEATQLRQGD